MLRSTPRALALALAVALGTASGAALAKTVKVVPGEPPITVSIPPSWEVSDSKRGKEVKTADDELYIWFESYRPSQFETILGEHNAYWKDQGVAITGKPKVDEDQSPTYAVKRTTYPATYEGKPTVLVYISIAPADTSKRSLLVTYWSSPEADKEYEGDVQSILESLKKSVGEY